MNNIFNKIFDVILLIICALFLLCMLASFILLPIMLSKAYLRYQHFIANEREIKIMNIYLVSSYILCTIGLFGLLAGHPVGLICCFGLIPLFVTNIFHILRKKP